MLKSLRKKIVIQCVILVTVALLLLGCGKKGPPIAPDHNPDAKTNQWETGCPCKGY